MIYPPVDVEQIQSVADWRTRLDDEEAAQLAALPSSFLLGASRFIPYKRLDLVIQAGEAADLPVVLAGKGPERAALEAAAERASVPVHFVHAPSWALLFALYQQALLFVFPAVEDFGIMPVEAMAAGAPVLAQAVGGTSESVVARRHRRPVPLRLARRDARRRRGRPGHRAERPAGTGQGVLARPLLGTDLLLDRNAMTSPRRRLPRSVLDQPELSDAAHHRPAALCRPRSPTDWPTRAGSTPSRPSGSGPGPTLRVWLWLQVVLPVQAGGATVLSMTSRAPFWRRRHVLVIHDLFVLTNPEWFSRRYVWTHAPLLRAQIRSAAAIVAVSQPVADQVAEHYPGPIVVAPNAPSAVFSDEPAVSDPVEPDPLAARGLTAGEYFLTVGSMDPRKNLPRLAQAYAALTDQERAGHPLVIVGGGSGVFRSEDIAWPAGTIDAGYVSDAELRALYSGARAVVFVSWPRVSACRWSSRPPPGPGDSSSPTSPSSGGSAAMRRTMSTRRRRRASPPVSGPRFTVLFPTTSTSIGSAGTPAPRSSVRCASA